MKRLLRTMAAGALVVVPLSITIYIVVAIGGGMDRLVTRVGYTVWPALETQLWKPFPGTGVIAVLVVLYLVGLLTRAWGFRTVFSWVEMLFTRLPGVKTIYESVRDLMKLFGGDGNSMGKAVLYQESGTGAGRLGIMTNERPAGVHGLTEEPRVAVFLPYAYMFGGEVLYVRREELTEVPMSVDEVLKLCATAHVGGQTSVIEGRVARPELPEGQ